MKPCNTLLSLAMAAGLALVLAAPGARARGALGYDQEMCVLKIGPDFLYFSGYQFAASQRKFCEDIPATGDTTLVFDLAQDELRQMKLDFKILRDGGETGDAARRTGRRSLICRRRSIRRELSVSSTALTIPAISSAS